MSREITVKGRLISESTISDEHLEMLRQHLVANELSYVATADRDDEGHVFIDFDKKKFVAPRNLSMNTTNFAFGLNVARIAELSEEINLGFAGEVIIMSEEECEDFMGTDPIGLPLPSIQCIVVAEGKSVLHKGKRFKDTITYTSVTPVTFHPRF